MVGIKTNISANTNNPIFFFNDTATTEIYTLSLHDALPISLSMWCITRTPALATAIPVTTPASRSEEHTSELQSPCNLVCRLLLEKKKQTQQPTPFGPDCHPP